MTTTAEQIYTATIEEVPYIFLAIPDEVVVGAILELSQQSQSPDQSGTKTTHYEITETDLEHGSVTVEETPLGTAVAILASLENL